MNRKDQTKLNELAINLSTEAGKQVLKVPGVRAVLVTLVGDNTPLGVLVYDKEYQGADTVLHAISRLSEHIQLLTHGLTGERYGQTAHDDVEQPEEVQGELHVREETHEDSPSAPDEPASQ